MNKLPVEKTIIIIALITAIGGLVAEFSLPFIQMSDQYVYLKLGTCFLFRSVNLSILHENYYFINIGQGRLVGLNIPNILFYILLLIGAILFTIKRFKQSHIISFCFAIIFFIHCIYVISALYSLIETSKNNNLQSAGWLIFSFINIAIWLFVSYYVIQQTRLHRELQTYHYETDGRAASVFADADKFKRFYNWIVDRIVLILIFSPWTEIFRTQLRDISGSLGDRGTLLSLLTICTLLYYPFFEGWFGITPGKLLTGTRVTNEYGNKPTFMNILGRTLCRFIPFDALSFFGNVGWHDSISRTYVIRDQAKIREMQS